MGTRHLIAVKANGQYKVAQYGQFDGYPGGQGMTVLEFLRSMQPDMWQEFRHKVLAATYISGKELLRLQRAYGADKDGNMTSEVYARWNKAYPQLNREVGGGILRLIYEGLDGIKLEDSLVFAKDSIFCEWAYVIDFDEGTLEVYEGGNDKKLSPKERFYCYMPTPSEVEEMKSQFDGEVYYPVKLKARFYLKDLPTPDEFLSITEAHDVLFLAKKVEGSVIPPEPLGPEVSIEPLTEEEKQFQFRDIS